MSDPRPRPSARLLADVTPLRQSVDFRWLYGGLSLAWLGRQLTVVAVPYQVYQLTGSTFLVGALGIAQLVPLLLTSIVGGAIVDSVDRRRLLVIAQLCMTGTAVGLAVNASLTAPKVWLIFVLSGLNAGVSAIDNPARTASVPALVGRDLLPAALALTQILGNVAKTVGPAIGGLLIARTSLTVTYGLEAVAFAVGTLFMIRIGSLKPEGGGRRFGWESIREGYSFLRERRLLQANFAIDLNAMIFGMPQALFPAIGVTVLGGDATTVGLLYAAPGAGALIAAVTSGWVGFIRRQGRAVVIAVIVWGVAIGSFGLAKSTVLAVLLLAVAGAADVVSAVFRNTILQLAVPDRLRGRLSSIHIAVVSGGPRLGDFEAGAVASVTSPQISVVSGGLACILGALIIARRMPEFTAYRAGREEDSPYEDPRSDA
ncbi:MAG TPA: MFS transporter [Acidimicrobiia bacterium]|nr:MFS transporter [Acidimicrobiia bacterium]